MRQIVLDTETTGLDPKAGHRIIEIGCVELLNRRITQNRFHVYINPEREIDAGAIEVHGLTNEFLASKPVFRSIADDFLNFIGGAELIIHNAAFDVGFLDHELALLGENRGRIADYCGVCDTLAMARKNHPGQRNSLDALCKRYNVDNSRRELHGALLDAEILADVYLAMTGGQIAMLLEADGESGGVLGPGGADGRLERLAVNPSAGFGHAHPEPLGANSVERLAVGGVEREQAAPRVVDTSRPPLRVIRSTPEEAEAHAARLEAIAKASSGNCLWSRSSS
ncbi:DNA polymerase III subunit epsilon [Methylococcus sp. ANG]|uniref:DNA polymerase III subunit epsilon n=1 Tax=unclassified Methylococcus TaxID=2618889 RepID=UPI001C52F5C8|nr:DNA polymerase III subunit epsilon [Methylococcus sp. Mc7]QXP84708.1 DNA polymerase III subunit epsilon [Methylococcus sp. Mc7]